MMRFTANFSVFIFGDTLYLKQQQSPKSNQEANKFELFASFPRIAFYKLILVAFIMQLTKAMAKNTWTGV